MNQWELPLVTMAWKENIWVLRTTMEMESHWCQISFGSLKTWIIFGALKKMARDIMKDDLGLKFQASEIGRITFSYCLDLYRSVLRSGKFEDVHFLSGASSNFIAGAAAGCTTLILIYPLDIAHTRLAADIGKTEVRQFQGIYHFLTTIFKKEGVRGIYRGLPASLHGMVVHRGIYFGGFDTIKEILSEECKPELALWKRWVVAQAVTTSAGLLSYPLDTVRRRMMMQSGLQQPMYHNTLDCWKKIYRTEGLPSFYRGALSNMFRSTGAAAILVLYDEVKKFMNWGRL
ncbi:hypothetical protein CJ030_MR3G009466 [Morella rubra]|uniref:ADP/ATP translocase n=1 Tax=Morella rubra TaxID=262757 RepID=A0A6A1W3L3_9ROSI|nr:hypothetical protein CJ030_MR3G009466 [Morella rubra]